MLRDDDPLDLLQMLAEIESASSEPSSGQCVTAPSPLRREVVGEREALHAVLGQAREAMDAHGLTGWELKLDRALGRAGATRYQRRVISLSAPLMLRFAEEGAQDQIRETILHEIAHALVGSGHHHDDVWRATALGIGSNGRRCVDPDAPTIDGDWEATCPAGHTLTRHKRPAGVALCTRCTEESADRRVLTWTYRGRTPADVGAIVGVTARGRWHGVTGTVRKVAYKRYHLEVPGLDGLLTVRFEDVELVDG